LAQATTILFAALNMDRLSVNNRSLKIAVVTQYFYPETFLINDLVEELCKQGHIVDVYTGKPNYPSGIIFDGFSQAGCEFGSYRGVAGVYRVPLRPRKEGGAKNLVLNYLSFVWNGLFHFPKLMRGKKYDAIFVYAPSPITAVVPAILMKFIMGAPLFLWVQDLWPESLEATGFVKNKYLLKAVGLFVRCAYACVDVLLVQSNSFIKPVSRLSKPSKVVYYPNSYRMPLPLGDEVKSLPAELVSYLKESFCIVFAGNLGTAQALDTILAAAYLLKDHPSIRIVMVGGGSRFDWLVEQVQAQGLSNMLITGSFAPVVMPELFSMSSGLLVSLKRDEIFSYTIPSKVQAYLAAGKPIIASLDGEGAKVILEASAGFTGSAENAKELAEAIIKLYELSSSERAQLGCNGKTYFEKNFEMSGQCSKLVEIFRKYVKTGKANS
jgi:glycosyltransferase involved in cell wall biosynthesis